MGRRKRRFRPCLRSSMEALEEFGGRRDRSNSAAYGAENKLSCQLYQRSADVFLGVPFNIASYALLTMMIAKVCDFELGDFVHTFGDAHIYCNHKEQVKLQLSREPRPLPKMIIHGDQKDLFSFNYEDFELVGYDPYPGIKAPVAI